MCVLFISVLSTLHRLFIQTMSRVYVLFIQIHIADRPLESHRNTH